MATQTAAADPTSSATDEQVEKKEKEEGIGEKTVPLSNENEDKHDKAEDAASPLSKAEEAEREEKKAEAAIVEEFEKREGSGAIEESVADNLMEQSKELTSQSQPLTITEPAADSATESTVDADTEKEKQVKEVDIPEVSDNVKQDEQEIIPDSGPISVTEPQANPATGNPEVPHPTEAVVEETPQKPETEEEEQVKEVAAETIEKSSNPVEVNPLKESESEQVKETENSETSSQKVETVVTQTQEKSEEAEKEKEEKAVQQQNIVSVPEPSAGTLEKSTDTVEEKTREVERSDGELVKENSNHEARPAETEKPESVGTEAEDHPSEPEKQSLEKEQEEQSQTIIPENAEKQGDVVEDGPPKESNIGVLKETAETEKPELQVEEKPREHSQVEKKDDGVETKQELVSAVVAEKPRERSEVEEKSKDVETEQELAGESAETEETLDDTVKEEKIDKKEEVSVTGNTAQVASKEEAEAASANGVGSSPVTAEKVVEEEKISVQVAPKEEAEAASANGVESSPVTAEKVVEGEKIDREEKISVTGNPAQVASKQEAEAASANGVESSPVTAEKVVEEEKISVTGNPAHVASKEEAEAASANGVESSPATAEKVVEEEKIDKEEKISVTGNPAQVASKEEAEAASANGVESSPVTAQKVAEEEGKKDEVEGVSKEVVGVLEDPQCISVNQETKTDHKEEKQDSAAPSVEEKNELKAFYTVEKSSKEAEVEISKVEEQKNEAKVTATEVEEEDMKRLETVKDDQPEVDNAENKVDDGSTAVSEPVRETLASKFEEEGEESDVKKEQVEESLKTEVPIPEAATKESDATKTAKDLPKETSAKQSQKQSNNIISKVKQSLVKAKKALTGKSPSSKNLASDTKGDIKVK